MCTVFFSRGTGHLVEKEKTSHYVQGGHTDYCWKSTGEKGYYRSETWGVSDTNRPAGKTSIGPGRLFYNSSISEESHRCVYVCVCVGLTAHTAPCHCQIICTKQSFTVVFFKPVVGWSPLTLTHCKRTKRCSWPGLLTPFSLSTSRSTISKNSCNTEEVHRCIVSEN